jgi:hypothetical protein
LNIKVKAAALSILPKQCAKIEKRREVSGKREKIKIELSSGNQRGK